MKGCHAALETGARPGLEKTIRMSIQARMGVWGGRNSVMQMAGLSAKDDNQPSHPNLILQRSNVPSVMQKRGGLASEQVTAETRGTSLRAIDHGTPPEGRATAGWRLLGIARA